MSGNDLEVEVKFVVSDLKTVRRRLLAAGATLRTARIYERNVRFDNSRNELKGQGKLLRLRQDRAARLTYKGESEQQTHSEARVRHELETEVADFEKMAAILEQIGFEARQIYEKYRETFELGSVEIVLDELPFGDFIELEGDESAIRDASAQLGLDWKKRILDNYLVLMARLKEHHDLPFDDLTFENFAGLEVSIADALSE